MDEQPDIVSSGSDWRLSDRRRGPSPSGEDPGGPGPGGPGPSGSSPGGPGRRGSALRRPSRRGWIAIFLAGALLTCLGVSLGLTRLGTPHEPAASAASTATRTAAPSAPAVAARPAVSGTAIYALPGAAKNSFSVVVLAVRPSPGSVPQTWLFVYGRDIDPGQRYGLLEDTCGGQYITASDVADGTADQQGYLTIVATNLDISPTASDVWILLYRQDDGTPVGGVQGPLTGQGGKTFQSTAPC